MMYPKPDYARQKRKRKNERSRRDREFQSDGKERNSFDQTTEYVLCACGHSVERSQLAKHHVVRRSHTETRWDDAIAARLCWKHHDECHRLGDVAFATKYRMKMLTYAPDTYRLLLLRRSPA